MHEASALLFRAADAAGMGGVGVSASGPSSAAVWRVVPARNVRSVESRDGFVAKSWQSETRRVDQEINAKEEMRA
jgi:hypothetical protein